jgi:uncharacterized PurR-regulated membrane protein YhhQ (DUF165 family)
VIILYLAAILAANILTATFPPISVFGWLIPQGSLLVGLTFILRDGVQIRYGRQTTYIVIAGALILSAVSTYLMGNGTRVVAASALAFAVSELLDTEIFTRIQGGLSRRVLFSGSVAGSVDSVVFVLAAGFPAAAIPGQLLIKFVMQGLAALAIKRVSVFRSERSTSRA